MFQLKKYETIVPQVKYHTKMTARRPSLRLQGRISRGPTCVAIQGKNAAVYHGKICEETAKIAPINNRVPASILIRLCRRKRKTINDAPPTRSRSQR